MISDSIVLRARRRAGLTQQQLADRMGTTQSAVARLESSNANPSLSSLRRAVEATGYRLEMRLGRVPANVDESLIIERLALTPAERLRAFEASYAGVREIALAGARARGELA